MRFVAPSSSTVQFSSSSKCNATSPLASTLVCTVSSDLSYIDVKVAISSRRVLATIASGATLALTLTNILNPQTFRPTANSFQYIVKSSAGYLMET